jgi:hypothetical protein
MPICAICGEDSDYVTKCKTCGDNFCTDCGDENQKLCVFCIEADEDEDESWDEENM